MSSALQVSKAARQEKKFQDYNERCTFHNQAKVQSHRGGGGGWRRWWREERVEEVVKPCSPAVCWVEEDEEVGGGGWRRWWVEEEEVV